MNWSRRSCNALLSACLSFLLVFTMLNGTTEAQATEATGVFKNLHEGKKAVISKEVNDAFKEQEYVEIIVEMQNQVDTAKIVEKTNKQFKADKSASTYQKKLMKRYAVVNALKSTSEKSQKELLEMLRKNDQVKSVKSFYIMNLLYVKTTKAVVKEIASHPEVATIRLDRKIDVVWPESAKNDIGRGLSAKQDNTIKDKNDSNVEWNIDRIKVPEVWEEYGVDGSGVVVGLIDTGAHWSHEALKEKWRGYNPLDPNHPNPSGNWFDAVANEGMPYDMNAEPHGTHVLGTILGQDPKGENKIGVAPGAKWIAAKAFTEQGGQDSWLLAAGEFMLAPNDDPSLAPDIINNSWGGGPGLDEWYRPMVQAWRDAGILSVFAAGNKYPEKVSAPANYPESYAVAAIDRNNTRGSFSNVGPGPYSDDLKPDIAAPGVNIRSSVPNGYEGGWNGTSMATPHVTGVAALLRSVDASITVDQIEAIINDTAMPLTDSQYPKAPNYGYGNGLINAYDAVSSIATASGKITGTVLKPGQDDETPEIIHEAYTFGYKGLAITLQAQITDNISVVQGDLYVRSDEAANWETIKLDRIEGDYNNGTYEIDVPMKYIKDPGFQYKIKATDFSGNTSETEINDVEISFGIDPSNPFEYNFEDDLEGMYLNGDWERGVPSVGTTPRNGEKLAATKLDGNYSDESNSLLQLPPIDLRNVEEASLSFKHWYDIEYNYDFAKVVITDDINAEEWQEIGTFTGRERTWGDFTVNLEDYVHSDKQVFVGLLFNSDKQTNHAGWYIDELTIDNSAKGVNAISDKVVSLDGLGTKNKVDIEREQDRANQIEGLPVDALITVVETGRTVRPSLEDGSYTILHQASPEGESYTLRVESYGYYDEEADVKLQEEQRIERNFLLREIPKGEITFHVIDKETKEPLEGVELSILEDSRIVPIETNKAGTNTFSSVLEGDYTIIASYENYHYQKLSVKVIGGEESNYELELEVFPGTLIAYDDGKADNARAFNIPGYGYAIKMTPDKSAVLKGASVYLWGDDWPLPGGNEFSVAVYGSNKDGDPGKRVIDPITVKGTRGQWNYVDLSNFNYKTDEDYYIVMIQNDEFQNAPGLGIDESEPLADRSYQMDNTGVFKKLAASTGNYMIRSHVDYRTNPPMIDGESETIYVNDNTYSITGTVDEDGKVTIYNDDQPIASQESKDLKFNIEVPLTKGKNILEATLTVDGDHESEKSNDLLIIQDSIKPEISIISPKNNTITNKEKITVKGIATDEYLDKIMVNGDEAALNEGGAFEHNVLLTEGKNKIEIQASDLAGNKQSKSFVVEKDTIAPVISNVTPNEDIYLMPEEQVRVSITSDSRGGAAVLSIKDEAGSIITELPMVEKDNFTYETNWTIPKGSTFERATFHIEHEDAAGNRSTIEAEGTLHLIVEKVARLYGKTRYETAVEISKKGWSSSEVVVLARGDEFADTLAGVPLAHQIKAPVLLTPPKQLYAATKIELKRLKAKKVIILGEKDAISKNVEKELIALGLDIERIGGKTRMETAALIADGLDFNTNKAIVVNGMNFPDALSVASFAAVEEIPILLTLSDKIPAATKNIMDKHGISETIVVGGPMVIKEKVFDSLPNPIRISGKDRFETNMALFKHFKPASSHLYVATGFSFADALTGATIAAKQDSGVLLMDKKVPELTEKFIKDDSISSLTVFGGEVAISDAVVKQLEKIINNADK